MSFLSLQDKRLDPVHCSIQKCMINLNLVPRLFARARIKIPGNEVEQIWAVHLIILSMLRTGGHSVCMRSFFLISKA